MIILHDQIKLLIVESLFESMRAQNLNLDVKREDFYNTIGPTPNLDAGHFAFPTFALAKLLKKSPAEMANNFEISISQKNWQWLEKVEAKGPYLNYFIKTRSFGQYVVERIIDESYFEKKLTSTTPKTMIEFSQPNTHKELHVGHMRNLCLGDALIRLHRYVGFDIVSATFPGDSGAHVAKCLWYLKYKNTDPLPTDRKGAWLGKMYSKAHNLLESELGSPNEEKNRAELTSILKELEDKKGPFFDLWLETRQWSINQMEKLYLWADVKFDAWFWESEVDSDSLKLVKEYFNKGTFTLSEGAIGADLSEDKLGFCLLIKSDGNGLYATKDLELARKKFTDYKIEKSIYIVDMRQALHFKQVFKCLEKMGFQNAKNCLHLQYDFVELPDGPMSSRKGNIVPIETLIDQMVLKIKNDYLKKYENTWSKEEIEKTANEVAAGAIRYGMIRIDNNKKIVFDLNDWLKLDGESGPYIQYAHARIQSLCEKQNFNKEIKISWDSLIKPQEVALMNKLSTFNDVALISATQYKTSFMTSYLYDLSKLFNSFYAECSIANAETNDLKNARLAVSFATAKIIKKGLALLGIPAPMRM